VGQYAPDYIMQDGAWTVYVYDSAGNQSTVTGQITISSVSSISASPSPFTPGGNNFATITANAASGLNLEAYIFNSNTNALTKSIPMTEASGIYTAEWDGRDTYGNFAGANTYRAEIYHAGSSVRYYPTRNFVVNVAVFAISASPDPFVPTGSNSTTITVLADALQSGLTTSISHPQSGSTPRLVLREVGSQGTYEAEWDGKINGIIPKDGVCTIRVYDSAGNEFPATGTLTLSSAKSLNVSSNPFEVTGTNSVAITAEMPTGLNLEARIGSVKSLQLQETGGIYTAQWDGRNDAGAFVASGTYNITLWNTDTNIRYDLQTSLVVNIVDVLPPQTSITAGPAELSYVKAIPVTFSWAGTDNMPVPLTFSYSLDGSSWSPFEAVTGHTFENLADGQHSFAVKARDQAGNEDPEPAMRNFTVDGAPPLPATNFRAITTSAGSQLEWTHSTSEDIHSYHLYWDNGTGEINYASPYATIYHPSNSFQVNLHSEGVYKFGLRAIDRAGNEENNTSVIATINLTGFTITVGLEHPTYDRGQDVPIAGNVIGGTGDPIVNAAVKIDIGSNGYIRTYTAYTNQAGEFRYVFQPLADEAGIYTVQASAIHEGLEKSSSSGFEILGLLLQPASVTLDMSMNSSRTVNLKLHNIGATALSGIQYNLIDNDLGDLVTGLIDNANLPTSLEPGASVDIPVVMSAEAGVAPAIPAVFSINIDSTQGSKETTIFTVKLHEAVSIPVVTPDPLQAGVRIGEPVAKAVTVTNEGFAAMANTAFTINDPQTYSWINIINGEFGALAPSESKTCQILIDPPADMALGTHLVQLDLLYDGTVKPVYLTVEITTATTGQVAFKVIDDTGSVVPGAEINLISKAFYVNVTPDGSQEYNNVLKGTTDAAGLLLFTEVPAGDYRYVIIAAKHDTVEGETTVEIGTTPRNIDVMMITNLVNVDFSVTPTTIQDQYSVNLNITYVTDLIKPTLYASPTSIGLSFFPDETYEGTITIKNTSNNAPVRNVVLNAAALDPVDNEVRIVFANDSQVLALGELAPQASVQVAFRATIPDVANAKLNSRNMGNIITTGDYTFSFEGEAHESTTTTPIPVLFWRPTDLALPAISFMNDETDGNLNDLEYQGTTYRLTVKSNRDMVFAQDEALKAVSHVNGGPDAASILESNLGFWSGNFNRTEPLSFKGDTVTFDIDELQNALETRFTANREAFLDTRHYMGFFGKWEDRENRDAYLMPISITTIRQNEIISQSTTPSGGFQAPSIPTFNEHGTVKIQIAQKVSLEREAFDAQLNLTPTVATLENVNLQLHIADADGNDASDLFFVVVTRESGISATLSGTGEINWQIIPSSSAGGDQAEGRQYNISASIDYSYSGESFSYTTPAESITVKPMPKLVVDYYLPYVVMAGKPVYLDAVVTNQGAGPAHNLSLSSAQPHIVENVNNVPVSFTLNGSSAIPDSSGFQAGDLVIDFGDVAAQGTTAGFWQLSSTKDGFFVELDSTLKHENYLGVELDPLIQEVRTHLVPAIGGRISQSGCSAVDLMVEVRQGGELKGSDYVDASGVYFIQDLAAGVYEWVVKKTDGQVLASREITILADQPTSTINETVVIDDDNDGMSDCCELHYFGDLSQNPDADHDSDGLTNQKECELGTDPTNPDTDGDGLNDGEEISLGKNPMVPEVGVQFPPKPPDYHELPPKQPGANNLVLIVHGWSSNPTADWVTYMRDAIQDSTTSEWEVIAFDWNEDAGNLSDLDPMAAYVNAIAQGKRLGAEIAERNYEHIHFIAHSAGSQLIQTASEMIYLEKRKTASEEPTIHLTFLDAYDPRGDGSTYGRWADFAEQYVDMRRVGTTSLDDTDLTLKFCFNFDVTELDIVNRDIAGIGAHAWPYRVYNYSINHDLSALDWYNIPTDADLLTLGNFYAFPLTLEGNSLFFVGSNDQCTVNGYQYQRGKIFDFSDITELSCETPAEEKPVLIARNEEALNFWVAEANDQIVQKSDTGIVEFPSSAMAKLTTGSPVWFVVQVDISDSTNTINYDYKFTSKANGLLSIFVDDQIVFKADEKYAAEGINHSEPIWVGNLEPGKHSLAFRLDGLTEIQSSVEISNVRLGFSYGDVLPDEDNDSIADEFDNCPSAFNPDQVDSDGNGTGDACESIPGDLDGNDDVDLADLNVFRASLGTCTGAVNFNSICDYDGDGCVTYGDYRIWYGYYLAAQ